MSGTTPSFSILALLQLTVTGLSEAYANGVHAKTMTSPKKPDAPYALHTKKRLRPCKLDSNSSVIDWMVAQQAFATIPSNQYISLDCWSVFCVTLMIHFW